ncbi:flhb domain protein, putative [Heliomicrobium modesticaldum Ice1]|uniref:Flhb domain protein, putative n=1 Tax=Heliobacterium modesticaldum (strain ATCC 51547 / Ice1) TaxID=498761 RepID=B0TH75_HELMI|nr:EscU/YscU/HrcU family type III secretion system export apparatus switch protein [Heliomicrobium modesticaldum]ABZ84750.1 flhb domain protein, putative [Heliomicrobium modesticaldum Ice1]
MDEPGKKPLSAEDAAVALRYDPSADAAPKVIATGKGHLARKILEIAREKEIPVYEDPTLVQLLSKLDLGVEIPPELYRMVAEVLAFVYRLDKDMGKGRD